MRLVKLVKRMKDTEFRNLKRYPNGRLMNLAGIFERLTNKQTQSLHEDDWSYYVELMEEAEIMFAEEMDYLS
jgi:hypothetical protein